MSCEICKCFAAWLAVVVVTKELNAVVIKSLQAVCKTDIRFLA